MKVLLFEKINQQAIVWVDQMMVELGTSDAQKALHALRAGLQALRDRLSVEEAAQLAAQMPLLIRGMFFEGWHPHGKPLKIRHEAEFLALVRTYYAPREDAPAADIVTALFRVLSRHISAGEITDVVLSLPKDLADVLDGGWGRGERPASGR
jgi:uncharacterized protein (DUF2267 family)